MKAVDYVVKYRGRFRSEDLLHVGHDLFVEFSVELKTLAETRHVKNDASVLSMVEEFNNKWNAVVRLLEKEGICVLVRDGFKKYWLNKLEEKEA